MTNTEIILFALSTIAITTSVATAVISSGRHKRLRRRLSSLDARATNLRSELLPTIRPLWNARLSNTSGRNTPALRGQMGEDMMLLALFEGQSHGFFVEAGAFDGRLYSATYVLESLGWDGLLVEPIESLAETARKNRPGSKVVCAALGSSDSGETATLHVFEPSGDARREMASHLVDAKMGQSRPPSSAGRYVEVPIKPLSSLLGDRGPIDLLVLDVEGAEMKALAGLDFDAHRPRVMIVEDHAGSDEQPRYLAKQGYEHLCMIDFNRVFIHSSETELLRRARDELCLDQIGIT